MPPRSSAEIRDAFLTFFEERDHLRVPSGSLIPSSYDPSVLLTTAGMQPLKPYFLGQEEPPHPRLTSCQKCFRTTDIDEVGNTARHLTFFEMLGNFSFGDYFKEGAIEYAWELSTQGFGLDPEQIWITVFEGDPELGLGPDEEAIELLAGDRRAGRADRAAAALGELLAGRPDRALRPVLGALHGPRARLRRRRRAAPAATASATSSTGTSSSCSTRCTRTARWSRCRSATSTPALGLDRIAAILQDVPSVYENDQFRPLVELGEQLSGRRYGSDPVATKALRVLADHGRAMTFLIADGVAPSNEDRGYILRRIMRRAIQQGTAIGLETPFLGRFADLVIEIMGPVYPELEAERDAIHQWLVLRGGELRPHARAGHAAARATWSTRAKAAGHVVDRRGGRVPAARHLRLPVRPDARAAPGRGARRRRRGLPRADGGAARARAHGRGARDRRRGRARAGARVRARRRLPDAVRRLRDDRGRDAASARCSAPTACC